MAGLRGNVASFAFAKQTVKGTPNTTYLDRLPFTEGNINPAREIDNLSETDSERDQGVAFVQSTGSEGNPGTYVRDVTIHQLLEFALGARVKSGAGPDYTHTVTPANALPYVTFYKELGDLLFEQFNDCKVNELTISAEAGQPLTATLDLMGRGATRLASQPAAITSLELDNETVYNFNDATVTLAGGATSLVSSFELTISNNLTVQQTDDAIPYDIVEGTREISLNFNMIAEVLAEYNRFHYGSTSGTAQSRVLGEVAAVFDFALGAANSINFSLPHLAYRELPFDPDAGGDPVTADVVAVAQRHATDPVVTAVVENQENDT